MILSDYSKQRMAVSLPRLEHSPGSPSFHFRPVRLERTGDGHIDGDDDRCHFRFFVSLRVIIFFVVLVVVAASFQRIGVDLTVSWLPLSFCSNTVKSPLPELTETIEVW